LENTGILNSCNT